MEIKFDVNEYPNLDEADEKQIIKIKGEGNITGREDDLIVVEFPDMEVISGNFADKSLKDMTKKNDGPRDETDDVGEF